MKNEKKNNKSLIIIIILVIMVLGLGSYIAYDKLLSNNVENNEKNSTETSVQKTISEEEALKIGNELWKYAINTVWGTESVWKRHYSEENEYGAKEIICDTTVEEVKKKYSSDFKSEWCCGDDGQATYNTLDEFVSRKCEGIQRGSHTGYKNTTLTVKEIQEYKIVFTAISTYEPTAGDDPGTTVKNVEKDFVIVKQNNDWVISYFYLPN